MRSYLESIFHVTDAEPYALYHAAFVPGENPVLLLHWHPEAEIFYLQEGELLFHLEQEEIHLHAGDAVFIPPRLLHTAHALPHTGGQLRALVFSTDLVVPPSDIKRHQKYVQPVLHDNQRCSLHFRHEAPEHAAFLKDLVRLFAENDVQPDTDLMIEGFIRVLWQAIYSLNPVLRQMGQQPEKTAALVQEAMAYIHEHYTEDVQLAEMADALHVSRSYLCRIFRQMTGVPPFVYLNKYRIMKSCELLASTDAPVGEIAGRCGFNTISYFNREFARFVKITPLKYRKRRE